MRGLLPVLAIAGLVLPACSTRERANPFDPRNPITSGRPAGFVALAGDRQVTLRWQPVQGNDLIGYQLFRRAAAETAYRAIGELLPTTANAYRDFPLANGVDFHYRLFFVFVSGLGQRPAEDVATPGEAVPWLVEASGTELVQITPDGRRVAARRGGFTGTGDVAANPTDGAVWVSDEPAGRVVVFNPGTGVTVSIPGLYRPRAVAVDPFDGTGWVCDVGGNLVHHFRANGEPRSLPIAPLTLPLDVAVDPQDGSVWICERGADRVGRYDLTEPLWKRAVTAPSRVAVDSITREGWVTSYTAGVVTRLSLSGQVLDTLDDFTSPLGVAIDARRGRIWVADPGAGRVIALRRDGSEEFRIGGLPDAGEISVDLGTGEAWAVLAEGGELVRLSPAGTVMRRLAGLATPIAVSVDPGGR